MEELEQSNVLVRFKVPYDTQWGENLVLTGSRGLLGAGDINKGIKMSCVQGPRKLLWEASLWVPSGYTCTYTYSVVNEHTGQLVAKESEHHTLQLPQGFTGSCILLSDVFQSANRVQNIYKSSAFNNVIFGDKMQVSNAMPDPINPGVGFVSVRFICSDFSLKNGATMYVYGNIAELGSWQESRAVSMFEVSTPMWAVDVIIPTTSFPFSYRYIVCDSGQEAMLDSNVKQEQGEPRIALLEIPSPADSKDEKSVCSNTNGVSGPWPTLIVQNDGHFSHRKLWQGSGLAIPVFSIRTRQSVGCGEFADLKAMVDFVSTCGMRVLQILPVNDTSVYKMWWDSYPYSAISVFALHPLYLRLLDLVPAGPPDELAAEIEAARVKLDLREVDYEATLAEKLRIARKVYDGPQGNRNLTSQEFKAWFAINKAWLEPYAAFCFLRDMFCSADHREWGLLGQNAAAHVARLINPDQPFHNDICFTYWLQWQLHLQLLDVADYARARRVVLKGDLPIGVAKRSCDTWIEPDLFRMDVSVGSPPDAFDSNGQNWGFPGYNWAEMKKDGYRWWRARLGHMAQYFTAYRVDHILGFFRVYEIPERHTSGALGHFRPSRPLHRKGLEQCGLWDIDRLTKPYITTEVLKEALGEDMQDVIGKYLEADGEDFYRFLPEWSSERALLTIQPPEKSPDWLIEKCDRIRSELKNMLDNVILLRDDYEANVFYPRFQLMATSSFAAFDASKHDLLRQLHDGYFYSNQDDLWADCARESLPALMRSTNMLMCGEDLGFVPACVPPVMHELGIIGLRIQRMPGFEAPEGVEFGDPMLYSYWTVASPSCHDTTNTRAWYEEDEARRERFYYRCLEGTGETPAMCTEGIMHKVAMQHMLSPAIFCIMPLQDWLALSSRYHTRSALEETINDPTNSRHYWRYRMAPYVEDLMADKHLISLVQNMHLSTGRTTVDDVGTPQ